MYGTIPLPQGRIADMCRLWSTKLILIFFRLRSTKFYYCFRFFAPGMYDTSCLNMKHLGAGHIIFVLTGVLAKFQQSGTLEASLQIF